MEKMTTGRAGRAAMVVTATMEATTGRAVTAKMAATAAMATTDCNDRDGRSGINGNNGSSGSKISNGGASGESSNCSNCSKGRKIFLFSTIATFTSDKNSWLLCKIHEVEAAATTVAVAMWLLNKQPQSSSAGKTNSCQAQGFLNMAPLINLFN